MAVSRHTGLPLSASFDGLGCGIKHCGNLPLPAGIGAFEGGLTGMLVIYGAPVACAVAAVLTYRAISTLLPMLLGGLAYPGLRRRPELAHESAPLPAR